MTQPHPQQEYIITEDQLSVLTDPHRGYSEYRSELKKIRSRPHTPAAPAMDTLADLKITASMLYEFCEWFCDYDCEEKPCNVTVSLLHERLEGIKKQMEEHPEYLEKWNAKRIEQKTLLRGGAP